MVYTVNITPVAHQDILNIHDYIKIDSENNAKKQMALIYDKLALLAEFPKLGGELSKKYVVADELRNVRFLVINKSYIAFYEILDDGILVYDVFSNRQESVKKLKLFG